MSLKLSKKDNPIVSPEEAVQQLTMRFSHELKAPINSITGLIDIARKSQNIEELQTILDKVELSIHHLKATIKDLSDLHKNNFLVVANTNIDLLDFIKSIVSDLEGSLQEINIKVNIIPNETIHLNSDKTRLTIILMNLLSNAVKYSDRNKSEKTISIDYKSIDYKLIINISDNGIGIPLECQPQIFDMFYRCTEQDQGNGIGLYLVKESLEKLGGKISVQSTLSVGSTFEIILPLDS
jgi:signal transduction histidine kinase